MSGSDRDSRPKQPPVEAGADDPWAKWRQSGTPAVPPEKAAKATVRPENKPKPKSAPGERAAKPAPVREMRQKPAPAAIVPSEVPVVERVKPEGTLGVRKSAVPSDERPLKRKPLRGGAVPKRATMAEKTAKPAVLPARSSNPKPSRDSGGESPWAKAAVAKSVKAPVPPAQPVGEAPEGVRLSKVMSERGICSRREADLWIERGWVFVDGEQVSELGSRIDPAAEITVSKEAVKDQAKAVTILLHKPVGYVSGQPEPGSVPAVDELQLVLANQRQIIGSSQQGHLSFNAAAGDNYYVMLNGQLRQGQDYQLSLAAVPEPETWAMLLAGLGIVTVAAQRRRSSSKQTQA